jgi:hypothetical protein
MKLENKDSKTEVRGGIERMRGQMLVKEDVRQEINGVRRR